MYAYQKDVYELGLEWEGGCFKASGGDGVGSNLYPPTRFN